MNVCLSFPKAPFVVSGHHWNWKHLAAMSGFWKVFIRISISAAVRFHYVHRKYRISYRSDGDSRFDAIKVMNRHALACSSHLKPRSEHQNQRGRGMIDRHGRQEFDCFTPFCSSLESPLHYSSRPYGLAEHPTLRSAWTSAPVFGSPLSTLGLAPQTL